MDLGKQSQGIDLRGIHTTELAERWGRRVRNLILENDYALGVKLQGDSLAAGRWATEAGGEYYAAGAGTGIAGFRGLFGLIDDPIRSRQDADSQLVRDRLWDWYLNDFRPRLIPNARQLLIQCMTGDTPVLMGDGVVTRLLRYISVGDVVATWDNGKLSTSTVSNWASNGLDDVFTIKMTSGISVKANARHPFLVCKNGVPTWIRVKDLRPGQEMFRVNGASGRARLASLKGVKTKSRHEDIAFHTTIKSDGLTGFGRHLQVLITPITRILRTVTELLPRITIAYLRNKMENVPSVTVLTPEYPSAGAGNLYRTMTTKQGSLGHFFVTPATWLLDTLTRRKTLKLSQTTSDFTTDQIVSIEYTGVEEVFDIEIDRTNNFIARLCVSHNTRWHEDDLAGRCLNHQPWEVLSLPAIAKVDDQLGRQVDEPLWNDDDYGYGAQLLELRDTTPPRIWSALYQQAPAPDEGEFFKSEWLKPVDIMPDPKFMRVYGASDYAVTGDGGDYTVHCVLGVDHINNLYLLDIWRGQKTSDVWVEAFCDLIEKYRPLAWAEENGQIKSGVGPFLEKRMRERRVYVNRQQFPTRGDKAVRARSIQGRMALDGLFYPKSAHWVADWRAEILVFPAATHDDQVDAMGLAGQLLDQMISGRAGVPAKLTLPEDGYSGFNARKEKTVDHMTL